MTDDISKLCQQSQYRKYMITMLYRTSSPILGDIFKDVCLASLEGLRFLISK